MEYVGPYSVQSLLDESPTLISDRFSRRWNYVIDFPGNIDKMVFFILELWSKYHQPWNIATQRVLYI